jgi:hypothetical protein
LQQFLSIATASIFCSCINILKLFLGLLLS